MDKNTRAAVIGGGSVFFLAVVFAIVGFKPAFKADKAEEVVVSEPIPEPVLAPPKNIPERMDPRPSAPAAPITSKKSDKPLVHVSKAVETKVETKVAEIESRVPAKPRSPKEAAQYSQIVWDVARALTRLDPVKSRKWLDEGMQFSDDPAYHSLSAVLYYRAGDYQSAKISAESALRAKSSIYMRDFNTLCEAVIQVIDSKKGSGEGMLDSVAAENIIGRF